MLEQSTDELTSAELGALERLLQQIERSASPSEAFNVEDSASHAQMTVAYQQALAVLRSVRAAFAARGATAEPLERIERAASRLAQAYAGLANPDGSGEHDRLIFIKRNDSLTCKTSARRRSSRKQRGEAVWIEYFSENLQCLRRQAGRTEEVSEDLRVVVKAAPAEFEFVRISYPERGIESYALVCDRFIKGKGSERLCLQLIDNDELIGRAAARPEVAGLASSIVMNVPPHAPCRGKRILVADDDAPLRRVLGKILTSAGYEVILVEDGKAAVEKAAELKPDLVITDGLMPKMHGFLVCKTLKAMRPAPKVILLTAVYTRQHYRFEARDRYGADELLTKPFEVAGLLECIERHLSLVPQALAG